MTGRDVTDRDVTGRDVIPCAPCAPAGGPRRALPASPLLAAGLGRLRGEALAATTAEFRS